MIECNILAKTLLDHPSSQQATKEGLPQGSQGPQNLHVTWEDLLDSPQVANLSSIPILHILASFILQIEGDYEFRALVGPH